MEVPLLKCSYGLFSHLSEGLIRLSDLVIGNTKVLLLKDVWDIDRILTCRVGNIISVAPAVGVPKHAQPAPCIARLASRVGGSSLSSRTDQVMCDTVWWKLSEDCPSLLLFRRLKGRKFANIMKRAVTAAKWGKIWLNSLGFCW